MSKLNGRLTNLERRIKPGAERRIVRQNGKVYLFWGQFLVRIIEEDLWDAI